MAIARNTAISLSGSAIGIVAFAVLTPKYLSTIGAERYGLLTVLLSVAMLATSFNIGMGPALGYRVAGSERGDPDRQNELFWSAMMVSTPFALLAAGLLIALLPLGLADAMRLSPGVMHELTVALPAVVTITVISILMGNVGGFLTGREAFLTLVSVQTFDSLMGTILPMVCALFVSNNVEALLYSICLGRGLMLLVGLISCWRFLDFRMPRFSLRAARSLFNYGGWVTLTSLTELVNASSDRIVLAALRGASAVPYYAIPQSISARSMVLPLSITSAAFPQIVARGADEGRLLVSRVLRVFMILTPGYCLATIAAAPALAWWLTPEFATKAALAFQLLAAALWAEGISAIYMTRINALGNPRTNFFIAQIIIFPYIGLLVLGGLIWGPVGIAAAYLVRSVALLILRARLGGMLSSDVRVVAIQAAILAAAIVFAPHQPGVPSLQVAVIAVAILGASTLVALINCPSEIFRFLSGLRRFRPSNRTGEVQP